MQFIKDRGLIGVAILYVIGLAALASAFNPPTTSSGSNPPTVQRVIKGASPAKPSETAVATQAIPELSADQALSQLMAGNARFVANICDHPNGSAARREDVSANGQHPFATILSCSDSRVPVEFVFDQGIGDLFVMRVAGNVCGEHEAGTIEYGVGHLGTPLLVVMGHTSCGAVTAATTDAHVSPVVVTLVENIRPAVASAAKGHPELAGSSLVPAAIEANVFQAIADLIDVSDVVREALAEKRVKIVGAVYDIESGYVRWLGRHPSQDALIAASEARTDMARTAEATEGQDSQGAGAPSAGNSDEQATKQDH